MSRRTQRRRGAGGHGNHADPSLVSPEALLNPKCLEEQLSRRLASGKTSPVPRNGAADTDDSDTDGARPAHPQDPAQVSLINALAQDVNQTAKCRADAEAIFDRGGDTAVQEELRAEIARTKRLESELAQLKKKAEAARRQHETRQADYAKNASHKELLHQTCKHLLAEKERLDRVVAEATQADEERRQEVKSKFDGDVDSILAKVEEQAKQKAEMLEENATLQQEFDTLKASFETMMDSKVGEWKGFDEATKEAVVSLQEQVQMHERLLSLCEMKETHVANLEQGTKAYEEQAALFGEKMGDFEAALENSSQVVELTGKQKEELQSRITQLQQAKEGDVQVRRQLETEVQKARARVRDMRKKLTQLERSKAQAQKRARAAQEHQRKLNAA